MLIPLGHEKTSARRWPVITFGLIAINLVVFLATNSAIQGEGQELGITRAHILMLAAMRPDINVPENVQPMVTKFREQNPGLWKRLEDFNRPVEDAWDAQMRMLEDSWSFQKEMDTLAAKYDELKSASVSQQYGFIPAEKKPLTYLSANFLHGGWLHLIGNMWFLWLAGFVLEDVWGRVVYTITYLLAGAAALQVHLWMNPGSTIAVVGASGAVAALMGAFLVRFPTMKIEMAWVWFFLFRVRVRRFKVAAYWLLPFWLLTEIFYGTIFGESTGVAHWAHVGGFAFGVVVAMSMRFSGLESKLDKAIESEVSLTSDPEISRANELLAGNQADEAITVLTQYMAAKPNSAEACLLLQRAHWAKGDVAAYHQAAIKGCELHLKARESEAALQTYDEFLQSNGDVKQVPPAIRLDLCRAAEQQQMFDRALAEYQKLAATLPEDRCGLQAQLGAAKLCMTKLNNPQYALSLYEAAAASKVPHLDLEPMIEAGMRSAKAALAPPKAAAAEA